MTEEKAAGTVGAVDAATAAALAEEGADLVRVLACINSEEEMAMLIEDLFTAREIREISQRLEVAQMLTDGKSYTTIEQVTGASATTIARVSKCVTAGSGGYCAALAALR